MSGYDAPDFSGFDNLKMGREGIDWKLAHHNPGDWLESFYRISKLPRFTVVEDKLRARYVHDLPYWRDQANRLYTTQELIIGVGAVRVVNI